MMQAKARKPWTPESFAAHTRWLDGVLAAFALIFAFFLGSFTARNADLWMDLATGRLISQGQYSFGSDPFAYTTPQTGWAWINHAWLCDWVMYRVAEAFGGPESQAGGAALVVLKALIVVALAAVMLLIHRRGQKLWIPVVCVTLGMIAASTRLLLQPAVVSLLFLALTLYLLFRPGTESSTRKVWLLPLVIALWANLDEWFLLGPVTIALCLVGEILQPDSAERGGRVRVLAMTLALGILACLISPFHIHGFMLPRDVWARISGDPLLQDISAGYLFSPFSGKYMGEAFTFKNPAALAYYLLVVLGLLSFVLNREQRSLSRLLVWLFFFLLSAVIGRTMPFFGVVGAVIASLNLQDAAARRFGTTSLPHERWLRWCLSGRYLSVVLGVALTGLAWLGLLHPNPESASQTRRVAWRIQPDVSLRLAALKLRELHATGVLGPNDHGFNTRPEVADYCAWFCPEERGYFDLRLSIFGDGARSYRAIRQQLLRKPGEGDANDGLWQRDFRDAERHINHVVLAAFDDSGIPAFIRLWDDPSQWTLLYADGRTFIFGWNDPESKAPSAFRAHALRFNALAFGGQVITAAPPSASDTAHDASWSDFLWKMPAPSSVEIDEAKFYQALWSHGLQIPSTYRRLRAVGSWAQVAGLIGAGAGVPAAFAGLLDPIGSLNDRQFQQLVMPHADPEPTGLLLLSIRTARRAALQNPEDAAPFGRLGLAYEQLWSAYERQSSAGQNQNLALLRQVQVMTNLHRALQLQPRNPDYHSQLAFTCWDRGMVDLALHHLDMVREILSAAGPAKTQSAEDFRKNVEGLQNKKTEWEKLSQLAKLKNAYEKAATNRSPVEKAQIAFSHHLVKQALDILGSMDFSQGSEQDGGGAATFAKLLLLTGRGNEIADPDSAFTDPWDRAVLAGANGDYEKIDQYLEEMLARRRTSATQSATVAMGQNIRGLMFQGNVHPNTLGAIAGLASAPLEWADLISLRGLIALEQGANVKATRFFGEALQVGQTRLDSSVFLPLLASNSPLATIGLDVALAHKLSQRVRSFRMHELAAHYYRLLRAAGNKE